MTRSPRLRTSLLAGASVVVLSAVTARAQSVDYGALEQVFGEPVTTSATGSPQKVSEAPVTMEIITQDDIRRSGADNIPDVLQFVLGIDVRRSAFGSADVGIRGYNQNTNPRVLVLVNGRQIYADEYNAVVWPTIPVELSEIRQIEVVKGPNSALFGFNAASGVINIITYDPLSDSVNRLSAQTGTQNLAEGSAVTTVHVYDSAGLRVSAGGFLAHEFDHPATESPPNPESGQVSADGKVRVAPGVEFGLSASKADSQIFNEVPTSALTDQSLRTNSVGARLSADTRFGLLNLDVYRNELDLSVPPPAAAETASYLYVVQANDLVKLSADQTVRVGFEYRNASLDTPTNGYIGGTVGYDVIAGSLMWNWDITPVLSLTNAIRLDDISLYKTGIQFNGFTLADYDNRSYLAESFNSGLVYKLTDIDTVRLIASRGLQTPSLFYLGFVYNGNPDLNPTIVGNYELGYDREIAALLSTMRLSLFYQTEDDVIGSLYGEPDPLVRSGFLVNNIGSSHEVGIEIGIKGHSPSGFRWDAGYAFTSVTDNLTLAPTQPPTSNIDFQHGTPEHMLKFGGGYSVGKWEFDAAGRWQSSWVDYRAQSDILPLPLALVRVPDYVSLNARIGYKVTEQLTFSVSAAQFNQSSLVTSAGLPTERRVMVKISEQF